LKLPTQPTASEAKPKNGKQAKPVEDEQTDEQEVAEINYTPKTFLIPYVLLMLRDSLLHGYAIWENLMLKNIPGLDKNDRATIYRILRQLEREGKVKSEWDTNTEGHPARRVYTLTDSGESFLQIWAVGLDQYRKNLDLFFNMYSPFGFNLKSRDGDSNSNSKGDKK